MDDKTKSIVAHLTILGWVIALILNQNEKGPNTSFYLRQMLGLVILSLIGWLLSMTGIMVVTGIWYLLILVLWIISLIGALSGNQKPLPVVGDMFQQWFKGIS